MRTKHIHKFTSERFVLPKACPSTITLTFTPLIYTAMFQNVLFNNIKNEFHTVELIFDFVYVFESARIKYVYAITHNYVGLSFICEI